MATGQIPARPLPAPRDVHIWPVTQNPPFGHFWKMTGWRLVCNFHRTEELDGFDEVQLRCCDTVRAGSHISGFAASLRCVRSPRIFSSLIRPSDFTSTLPIPHSSKTAEPDVNARSPQILITRLRLPHIVQEIAPCFMALVPLLAIFTPCDVN